MPEGCRRNDRPTARWVSRTRGGPVVESLTRRFMTRRLTPARATSSRPRPSPARLFIVFETTEYTESSPLFPRARARHNRHTTGRDSPSSPLGGASIARARMEGSTVRDDARASVPGARRARARRGERAGFFFCSFAVRSPIGRRSDGNRRARSFVGDRARGRAEPRSRRLSVVRGHRSRYGAMRSVIRARARS
jgi:hypothetical protein